MQRALTASCGGIAASMVLYGHHQYTHSIPFVYTRSVPHVVTIDSVGSKLNPYDVRGDRVPVKKGVGSGFIVLNSKGKKYVATNLHVVYDSEQIFVRWSEDGDPVEASVEEADPFNDIAILRVNNDNITDPDGGLRLCSEAPEIGEDVLAIGSPFGLENSLSVGVVSGVNRQLASMSPSDMIQTDAPINPGNSGGPLIARWRGCVIGMNTSAIDQGTNVGFAVPAPNIKAILNSGAAK
jgi:serine protease Do